VLQRRNNFPESDRYGLITCTDKVIAFWLGIVFAHDNGQEREIDMKSNQLQQLEVSNLYYTHAPLTPKLCLEYWQHWVASAPGYKGARVSSAVLLISSSGEIIGHSVTLPFGPLWETHQDDRLFEAAAAVKARGIILFEVGGRHISTPPNRDWFRKMLAVGEICELEVIDWICMPGSVPWSMRANHKTKWHVSVPYES
jgi:hypothetical protein